jgi:hypothetical protein
MAEIYVHHDRGPWQSFVGHPGDFTAHDEEGNTGHGTSRQEAIENLRENIELQDLKDRLDK